ncbi:MAG: PEP-CTERM sorting domain-containing protein [Burkholderiales bacterium]|nr:PEP-CTERM sorting domain-containing protein [Burkholderiales bacterium]
MVARTAMLALAALSTGVAHAELVTNGGFEAGDFSGWTQFGDTALTVVSGTYARTGSFGAGFANVTPGGISQTLATVAGATYHIEYFVRDDGLLDNYFSFNWDGGAPEHELVDIIPGYGTFFYDLVATSSSTDLRFSFANGPSAWSLDDVSVTRVGDLPEPAPIALLGLALATMRLVRRRIR